MKKALERLMQKMPVIPRVLSLESFQYFGASKHFSLQKKRDRYEQNFDRVVKGGGDKLVWCCKLSLYANESCDEHTVYFQ